MSGATGRPINLPGVDMFNKVLGEKYEQTKLALIKELQAARKVCTASDVWSARGYSYIGMSAHFINEKTLERKSFLLAFRRIKGKCTYDVLGRIMYEIHNEFGLKIEKLTHCITDGGSNYCKAFRIFGFTTTREEGTDEQTDEQDEDLSEFEDEEDELEGETDDCDDIDIDIVANIIDLEEIRTDYEDIERIVGEDVVLPKQMRCCSHMLKSHQKSKFYN